FNDPSWSPANIRSEQGGLVEGMVYEVEEKDLKILDGYEKYYQRLEVKVMAAQEEKFDAVTYFSKKSRGEKPPTQEYLNFLLEGKSFLSREYFDELSRIQVIPEDSMKQEHLPESS
ncbi:MAG: gamma-glutamylcyclotransferase family protein, partial [SAR324 cluster bacterium]|nr:gamma-glutamylcyclotransferase family protein [SAR324 cluster bacterium]